MVWQNLGNCADQMFLKENSQPVLEFNDHQLVTMQCKEKPSLDKWFSLHFSSGSTITAHLDEEFIMSTFYTKSTHKINKINTDFPSLCFRSLLVEIRDSTKANAFI